jgi:hypothetical protein
MGMVACGQQLALPFAEPDLRLPVDGLDRCRELFQAPLQVTTDLGWIPIGPGPFAEGTTGRGIPSLGHAALLTARPAGLCCGREPQLRPELSRVLNACQVSPCRHRGHRHGELATAQSLEGLDHRR